MSQQGVLEGTGGGGGATVLTLTGNSGGAVPATANNINILGTGTISVAGNPGTSTLTISDSLASTYISLTPYIVGQPGDTHAGFTTIQSAITQAVADGASAANPKYIYIKPGTYAENLTLADGISAIGLGYSDCNLINTTPLSNGIILNGSVTLTTGTAKLQGFSFRRATGSVLLQSGGTLFITGCDGTITTGTLIVWTTATSKQTYIANSTFVFNAGSSIVSHDGTAGSNTFNSKNTDYDSPGITSTLSGASGTCAIVHAGDRMVQHSYSASCATAFFQYEFTETSGNAANPIVTTAAGTLGQTTFDNCRLSTGAATGITNIGNAAHIWGISNSVNVFTTTLTNSTFASSQQKNASNQLWYNVPITDSALVFNGSVVGWAGSEQYTKQAFLQTANAVTTTIATIPVPALGTTTVKGTITGQTPTATDATCGDFLVAARNPAGTAILANTPVTNVMATSTGTFSATVSGANILIQVTGIAATTINWSTTYSYQSVLLNT